MQGLDRASEPCLQCFYLYLEVVLGHPSILPLPGSTHLFVQELSSVTCMDLIHLPYKTTWEWLPIRMSQPWNTRAHTREGHHYVCARLPLLRMSGPGRQPHRALSQLWSSPPPPALRPGPWQSRGSRRFGLRVRPAFAIQDQYGGARRQNGLGIRRRCRDFVIPISCSFTHGRVRTVDVKRQAAVDKLDRLVDEPSSLQIWLGGTPGASRGIMTQGRLRAVRIKMKQDHGDKPSRGSSAWLMLDCAYLEAACATL